jgi:hypothetical protein
MQCGGTRDSHVGKDRLFLDAMSSFTTQTTDSVLHFSLFESLLLCVRLATIFQS